MTHEPRPPAGETRQPSSVWRRRWPTLTLFSAIGVVVLGVAIAWTYTSNLRKYPPDIADPDTLAFPLPERPSVVVLPFTAVTGGDRDGLAAWRLGADLQDVLVRVPGLFVIARETATRFRGARFQVKKTAETLGIRYLITGTLSRRGDIYRIFYRLLDAFTREVEWVGDYKRPLKDLPATRDLALTGILDELDVLPGDDETAGLFGPYATDPDAWLAAAEAIAYRIPEDRDSMRGSLARLQAAAAPEPKWSTIPAEMAWSYLNAVRRGWTDADDIGSLIDEGIMQAERVIRNDPADPRGPARKADLLALRGDTSTSLIFQQQAVELGPNDFVVQWDLAQALIAAERSAAALPVMRRALRLHPLHPVSLTQMLAELELAASVPEAALESLSTVIARRPADRTPRVMRIYILGSIGRLDEARRERQNLLELHPEFRLSRWVAGRTGSIVYDHRTWAPILLKAGIPN